MSVTQVPFFRPSIGEDEIAEVVDCLRSGWVTTGPRARAFEEAFAEALGGGVEAVAVNSATAAMHLALEAAGIGPGAEVIVPTLAFTEMAEVVRYMGAEPVLVDIDPETLCTSPASVRAALTDKTMGIMPMHFGGRPCDMTGLSALADAHGLALIDNAGHAFPAAHQGTPIGAGGATATAFSLYANTTITTGEGGMLVTGDPAIAKRARTMRLHGIDRDVFDRFTGHKASWVYDVIAPGFKYNLTDVAAALGLHQLRRAEAFHAARQRLAARYDAAFRDLPLVLPPRAAPGDDHSWHLYIVQLAPDAPSDRTAFIAALQERGIGISVHYRPLHQLSVWRDSASTQRQTFPNADAYFLRCVTLPLFMDMSEAEQDHVIASVRAILGAAG